MISNFKIFEEIAEKYRKIDNKIAIFLINKLKSQSYRFDIDLIDDKEYEIYDNKSGALYNMKYDTKSEKWYIISENSGLIYIDDKYANIIVILCDSKKYNL